MSNVVMAARFAGAYIEYRWNANATRYDFTLYIYKDCSDNDRVNDFEMIKVRRGAAGSQIDEFQVDRVAGAPIDVGNICAQQQLQSACLGGTVPSIEKYTYRGSYRLPAPQRADNWIFYWFNTQQPRIDGINGVMANANGPNVIYIEASLNNLDAERSTPVFNSEPNFFISPGEAAIIDNSAYDNDGNQVRYSLRAIRNAPNNNYTYNAGFSPGNPIAATFFQLNGKGIINTTPAPGTANGAYAVVVNTYDAGRLVTSTMRDLSLFVREDNDLNPVFQPATGGNIFGAEGDTIVWCYPYEPQTITIQATNAEAGQIVRIIPPDDLVRTLPGVVATTTPGGTGTFTFTWTPDSPGTRRLVLTSKDGACPREGVSQKTYVLVVRDKLIVSLPQNTYVACEKSPINLPSAIRNGQAPYTYSWTAIDGAFISRYDTVTLRRTTPPIGADSIAYIPIYATSDTSSNIIVAGIGTYTLKVTDRFGCVSTSNNGSDTASVFRAFGKAWTTAIGKPYQCFNRQVPPSCLYEGCIDDIMRFRYQTLFGQASSVTVNPTSWVWSFGRTPNLRRGQPELDYLVGGVTSGTTSSSAASTIWKRKGVYRVKVQFKAMVIFNNGGGADTTICDYSDSIDFEVYRKPDLNVLAIDSCRGERYAFYNDASGRISGRFNPAKPIDTLECRSKFGQTYDFEVYRMNFDTLYRRSTGRRDSLVIRDSTKVFSTVDLGWGNPGQPPKLQASCDTIRFINPQALTLPDNLWGRAGSPPPAFRFWVKATNGCGDSLSFYDKFIYPRPVFWPTFTPVGPNPPVTWKVIPRGCPVSIDAPISDTLSPAPYVWHFEGSLTPNDTISGSGLYDKEGTYLVRTKDAHGCTFQKDFQVISDVVLNTIGQKADCQSPNCYEFNGLVLRNKIGNTALAVIFDYGDGKRDTIVKWDANKRANPEFRRKLAKNIHCYETAGTFNYSMIIISTTVPDLYLLGGVPFPPGGRLCRDSISTNIYVDEVVPGTLVRDTSMCYVGLTASGLPYWEPLEVDAPYTPGVTDWALYPDLNDPRERIEKRFNINGNGRITYANFRTPGKYTGVVVTNLANGCARYDTFSFELAMPITGGIFTSNNCYPSAPISYEFIPDSLNAIGRISDMLWDFGDGTTIIGKDSLKVSHQYSSETVQTIRLTVTDSLNCAYQFVYGLTPPDFPPICVNGIQTPICGGSTRTFFIPAGSCLPRDGRGLISWQITGPESFNEAGLVDTIVTHTYNQPGTYNLTITVERQDGRCSRTQNFPFIVYANPTAVLAVNSPCEGDPVVISASGSKGGFVTDSITNYNFVLDNGLVFNGPDSLITTPIGVVGNYTAKLFVTTQNGCIDSTSVNFRVKSRPNASFTYRDLAGAPEVQAQDPIVFTSTSTDNVSRISIYGWDFGDGTSEPNNYKIIKTYNQANVWRVIHTATNDEGCSDVDTQYVDLKAYMVYPTAFTPNSDGLNDNFKLITRGLESVLEFRLYNRWGQEVFNGGTDRYAAWDGTTDGIENPSGVYILRASGITIYGDQLTVDGKVVLIR